MFKFWWEYCEMAYLLLDSIAAERDAKWLFHLHCFKRMLVYDRAYDHLRYFKWGMVYLMDMSCLPDKHPELYQNLIEGNHSVSR